MPRFVFGGGSGVSAGGMVLSAGGSVGYAAKLADGFRLMPELGVEVPVVGAAAGAGASGAGAVGGGLMWQFKLGVLLGKTK